MIYRFLLYHPDLKTKQVLKFDPQGWDAQRKTFERDTTLHGVFTKYNPDLLFVKDGRSIIASLYNKYGIEGEIILYIERKNPLTRVWENKFTGRLNLTTLVIDRLTAKCNIDDVSFYVKFNNRQSITVNLQSLVDQDGITWPNQIGSDLTISMHSKTIRRACNVLTEPDTIVYEAISPGPTYYIVLAFDNVVADEVGTRQTYPAQMVLGNPVDDKKYIIKADEAGKYTFNTLKINQYLSAVAPINWTVKWFITYGTPGSFTTTQLGTTQSLSTSINAAQTINPTPFNINLLAGDELYLYGTVVIGGFGGTADITQIYFAPESEINLSADTFIPASNALVVPLYEVWQRVVRSCTGAANSFKSNFYGRTENGYASDGPGSLRGITNGNQLRGFSATDKPIYASAKDLLATFMAIDGVGMGLERNTDGTYCIRVEPIAYFYQNVKALRVNNVLDVSRSVATDYYYNELEVGYTTWNNRGKQLNNLDEFNSKRNYALPITQVKKKLSLVSPYIASGYCIEFARRAATDTTTDTEQDNSNFIIDLRRNGFGALVTEKNEGMTLGGIIDPSTVYNARLSPMNMLVNNGPMIRSNLFLQDTKQITMTTGEGNNAYTSYIPPNDTGFVPKLETGIAVNKLGQALWKPEYYDLTCDPSESDWEYFENNPNGYVEVSTSNKGYLKGFLIIATPDATTRRVKLKILAAA